MTNRPIVQLDIQDPVMDIGHFFNIWRGMLVNGAGIPVIHNWQVIDSYIMNLLKIVNLIYLLMHK